MYQSHTAPQVPQRPYQDRGRADTVAVVVTMDGDPEFTGDRLHDLLGYLGHAVELARVVGLGRVEEGTCFGDRPVAATDQGHRDGLSQVELVHQRPRLGVGVRLEGEAPLGGSVIRGRYGHLTRLRTPGDGTAPQPRSQSRAATRSRRTPIA